MDPYEGNAPYLFVSYSHKDRETVLPYISFLQQKGCRVWYDAGNHAGDDWTEIIANHLIHCDCFLLFISSNSVNSRNVANELATALDYKKRVLPFYLEATSLTVGWEMQLKRLHAIILNTDQSENQNVILGEIPMQVFQQNDIDVLPNSTATIPQAVQSINRSGAHGIKDEAYQAKLKKALIFCIGKKYKQAKAIYESILDNDPEDMNGYMGLIRVATKNYTPLKGNTFRFHAIEKTIQIAKRVSGADDLSAYDADYAAWFMRVKKEETKRHSRIIVRGSDTILKRYRGKWGDICVPDGVTSIGSRAFKGCSNLTSIHIPGSVRHIGGGAFSDCNRLKNVTFEHFRKWQVKETGRKYIFASDSKENAKMLKSEHVFSWVRK